MNPQLLLAKIKQYPIAVGGVGVILIVGILFFLRQDHVPELEGERKILEIQWDAMQKNTTQASELAEHLKKIKEFSEEVKTRLMVRESKAINQQYFYGLEEKTGVTLASLNQSNTPPPPRPPPGKPTLTYYSPVEYSISIAGSFQQVIEFIYRLEHGHYFIRIDGFSCNSIGGDVEDEVQVSLKMDILGQK